ncbi:MAG: ABC transporter permease subunit [Xanthomonadaceae bacterium]|nr:ABC transporter permease subunit [Xanthomonadaceae bacterium]
MSNTLFSITIKAITWLLVAILALFLCAIIKEFFLSQSVRQLNFNEIWFAVKLSLLTATASSVAAIFFAIPIGYYLSRYHFRFQGLVDTFLDLPLVLSPIALGAMILIFFNTGIGTIIEKLAGGIVFGLAGGIVFGVKGIIVAQFFVIIGLGIRQVKLALEAIDPEFENIARTLGCTQFKAFKKVTLPLAAKGILSAFLLVWARAVGEFGATITIAGATTMKTETIPTAIFLSFESADIHGATIFILILVAISLTLLYGTRKLAT